MNQPLGQLGKYVLVRELGRGGMGVVYEARDPEHPERELALKLILAQGASPDELLRFQREALALARFSDKHVVPVHDLIQSPRGPCLITDLIHGEDLGALRKKQEFGIRECARLVRDVADGVQALHAEGIVHRDLKPQNVMLTPEGRPVLLDFGLVRQRGAESLTQTGTLLGTPAYMSPEQAGGEERVDELTDVYALGAVLYFLITGGAPYRGSAIQVLHQVLRGATPPTPTSSGATSHPHLDAICLRAMAPAPQDRYPSAGDLRDALDDFLNPPAPTRKRARLLAVVGVLVLVALVAGLSLRGQKSTLPSELPALDELLTQAHDQAQATSLLDQWLNAYPDHPQRVTVEGWRTGYGALATALSPPASRQQRRTPLQALETWLERQGEHPARGRAEEVRAGSAALAEALEELSGGSPEDARRTLTRWRDAHSQHPDQDWLSEQLSGCDAADRLLKARFPTPEREYKDLQGWESDYPDLPAAHWFGLAYRRLALEVPLWTSPKPTKCDRPRVRFLPGSPTRFVTWGYQSKAAHEPLRVWGFDPAASPAASPLAAIRFTDAAVQDLEPAPDGKSVSVLLALLDGPRESATVLLPSFELPEGDAVLSARALVERGVGQDVDLWARWLARADPASGTVLALAGNRSRWDPAASDWVRDEDGQPLGEAVIRVVRRGEVWETVSNLPARDVALSDDGALVAVPAGYFNSEYQRGKTMRLKPQRITLFDATSPELAEVASNNSLAATPGHVGFLPDSHRLVASTNANNVLVFDQDLQPLARLRGEGTKIRWGVGLPPAHNGAARGFVVDPRGRYLLSICGETSGEGRVQNELRVWRTDALDDVDVGAWRLLAQHKALLYVDLGPDGWLALGTLHGVEIRRWFHEWEEGE